MVEEPPLPIVTRRFLLRDFRVSDAADFIRYQTDPAFTLHHAPEELGIAHARSVFQRFLEWRQETPRLNYQLAICHPAKGDRLIGSCGVRRERLKPGTAEFGIELVRSCWGRHGYATEIGDAMIEWAFTHLPVTALLAETALGNDVAARLADRAGFERLRKDEKQMWRLDLSRWRERST